MFCKQVYRNASRNRKKNGLFFSALVIAIVAFYTLLSLGDQDVMLFLKTMEGNAVNELMQLIPIVYIISLFFVFFLVFFAYRYQLEDRQKEFGLYLMLGMKRSKLFALLFGETLWNSIVSILLGLPIALLLTEGISLATSKLVGLGIIGHKITFSISAVLGTVVGFMAIQIIAMLFLSAEFSRKEPAQLLRLTPDTKQISGSTKRAWFCFAAGLVLLISAYFIGVTLLESLDFLIVASILIFGVSGTLLLYYGLGVVIGKRIEKKSPTRSGLFIFTVRQIQETVTRQYKTLGLASLLLLMALSCLSFGIGVASGLGSAETRTVDLSIEGSEQEVRRVLDSDQNRSSISTYYPMYLGFMDPDRSEISWDGLIAAITKQPESESRDMIKDNLNSRSEGAYLISETSYNNLLNSTGKDSIRLEDNQVALYSSMKEDNSLITLFDEVLKSHVNIQIDNQRYELLPNIYFDNIVADRKITLYIALIVPDKDYQKWIENNKEPFCWNVVLSDEIVKEKGLMQAIQWMEKNLAGLDYESYISGVGRNLFYTVAASYLTIYLGILFLVIANTVIGLKYLMEQHSNKKRYLTLFMLGAKFDDLYKSVKEQIRLFFFMAIGVAICSSGFAIWSMFSSLLRLPAGTSLLKILMLSLLAFILFVVVEFIYIHIIEKSSCREINSLQVNEGVMTFE